MVQTSVILEQLKQLTLAERLAIVEAMLQSIRQELFPKSATPAPKSLAEAAQLLLADYTTDAELVAFTALDGDDFYVEG